MGPGAPSAGAVIPQSQAKPSRTAGPSCFSRVAEARPGRSAAEARMYHGPRERPVSVLEHAPRIRSRRSVDAEAFRAQFPVLRTRAYFNTGTDGPLPQRSADATLAQLERELACGRSGSEHFDALQALADALREQHARLLGARTEEVALTRSTTDGINLVLAGLG